MLTVTCKTAFKEKGEFDKKPLKKLKTLQWKMGPAEFPQPFMLPLEGENLTWFHNIYVPGYVKEHFPEVCHVRSTEVEIDTVELSEVTVIGTANENTSPEELNEMVRTAVSEALTNAAPVFTVEEERANDAAKVECALDFVNANVNPAPKPDKPKKKPAKPITAEDILGGNAIA